MPSEKSVCYFWYKIYIRLYINSYVDHYAAGNFFSSQTEVSQRKNGPATSGANSAHAYCLNSYVGHYWANFFFQVSQFLCTHNPFFFREKAHFFGFGGPTSSHLLRPARTPPKFWRITLFDCSRARGVRVRHIAWEELGPPPFLGIFVRADIRKNWGGTATTVSRSGGGAPVKIGPATSRTKSTYAS